jgi:hypothetical protein
MIQRNPSHNPKELLGLTFELMHFLNRINKISNWAFPVRVELIINISGRIHNRTKYKNPLLTGFVKFFTQQMHDNSVVLPYIGYVSIR